MEEKWLTFECDEDFCIYGPNKSKIKVKYVHAKHCNGNCWVGRHSAWLTESSMQAFNKRKNMKKINWALLLFVGIVTIMLLGILAILKAKFFILILPIIAIGFLGYMGYTLLVALGYGDEPIKKEDKPNEQDKT